MEPTDIASVETTEEAGTSSNVSLLDKMKANLAKKKKTTTVNTLEQRVETMSIRSRPWQGKALSVVFM